MNLKEINHSLEQSPPKTEIELQTRVLEYCIKNEVDFIEVSTVGYGYSKINKYSENVFCSNEFAKKGEAINDTNKRLCEYIKTEYLEKKDCVVWFSTFFGLVACRFYDAQTNTNINIGGSASKEQKVFKELVNLLHK